MDRFVSIPIATPKRVFEEHRRGTAPDEELFEIDEYVISRDAVEYCQHNEDFNMVEIVTTHRKFLTTQSLEEVKNLLNGRLDGYI